MEVKIAQQPTDVKIEASVPVVKAPELPPTPKADELLKRMGEDSKAKATAPNVVNPSDPSAQSQAQVSLDDIKDPAARKIVEDKIKNLESHYNKKYQSNAEKERQLESLRQDLERKTNQPWTPQRVQEILKDQSFVQAAQTVASQQAPQGFTGTTEEWSALTESEKKNIQELQRQVQNQNLQLNRMLITKDEEQLKQRYSDYDSEKVENFYRDVSEGRIPEIQIRELIYKALHHDDHLERTYQYAMQDKTAVIQNKINGSTQLGLNTQTAPEPIKRAEGERGRDLFMKIFQANKARVGN